MEKKNTEYSNNDIENDNDDGEERKKNSAMIKIVNLNTLGIRLHIINLKWCLVA